MKRSVLTGLALAAVTLGSPAEAQEYPYCLEPNAFTVGTCSFETLAQCQAAASGNIGTCVSNPRYVAPPQPAAPMPAPQPPAKRTKAQKQP
jgi:hypothetical protein